MKSVRHAFVVAAGIFSFLSTAPAARAEIVEEIVAWVNGDIITLSDYKQEEQNRIAEIYRRFSGEELDAEVARARKGLLLEMIDRKILVHHGKALGYDLDKMADAFVEIFMGQQNIETEEELERLAEADGMTMDQIRTWLIEVYAPDEVIRSEVTNRISISQEEIESFYDEHPEAFEIEGEVTLREIVLMADTPEKKDERRPEAEKIRERAVAGDLFSALAREFSESGTKEKGGEFGPLKRSDLSEILVEPAFSLPVGSVSEVMETPYGFHIIKVESRIDTHLTPLAEEEDRIRAFLRQQRFMSDLETFLERARADSEWCVKPKYEDLLSIPAPPPCERL